MDKSKPITRMEDIIEPKSNKKVGKETNKTKMYAIHSYFLNYLLSLNTYNFKSI